MKYKILSIIILFSLLGCESILDVEPKNLLSADSAISSERGVQAALNGVYDGLQTAAIAQDVIIFGDLAADNLIHVGSKKEYRQISDNRIYPDNVYIEGLWNDCYDNINRINTLLEALPGVDELSENKLKYYEGQAYFLRALNYFNLVKFYGGVPLKTESTTNASPEVLNIARSDKNETYEFIMDDLDKAESRLAVSSPEDPSHANYWAVKALMARIHLYRESFTDAYLNAKDVINNSPYQLATDSAEFANIFDEEAETNEIIFQVDFSATDDNNAMASWTQEDGRFEVAAWESYDKEYSIADEYTENDWRKEITVKMGLDDYYCDKYNDLSGQSDNIIFLRIAEMYLICAEALNETGYVADGWAFDYLNAVHSTAGLDSLTSTDITNKAEFRDAVMKERRLELAFEGHRYFDLVRTGKAPAVLGNIGTLAGANWLFPIPQSELDANTKMTQNPGY
jgi:hypothetical protein